MSTTTRVKRIKSFHGRPRDLRLPVTTPGVLTPPTARPTRASSRRTSRLTRQPDTARDRGPHPTQAPRAGLVPGRLGGPSIRQSPAGCSIDPVVIPAPPSAAGDGRGYGADGPGGDASATASLVGGLTATPRAAPPIRYKSNASTSRRTCCAGSWDLSRACRTRDERDWVPRLDGIADSIREGWDAPPVIAEYMAGELVVNDGNYAAPPCSGWDAASSRPFFTSMTNRPGQPSARPGSSTRRARREFCGSYRMEQRFQPQS